MLVVSAIRAGTTKRGFLMKKRVVVGMLALALVSMMGLLGCASVDQRTLKKAGVAKDQRADLYWVGEGQRLEKIDGKKQGWFLTWYGILKGLPGGGQEAKGLSEPSIRYRGWWGPVQVSAGEHTIVISDKGLIGRKNYEGTFKFEAGKKYIARLVTPTLYESMQKGLLDSVKDMGKDLAGHMKESLAGNQFIIVAESKKQVETKYQEFLKTTIYSDPVYPDYSINASDWKKSIK
jgi:hypothetical protein